MIWRQSRGQRHGGQRIDCSGPISQTNPANSVTLNGSGKLVLSGSDSYTGGTTVASGTVQFTSPEAVPTTGIVTVNAGGRVVLGAGLGESVSEGARSARRSRRRATTPSRAGAGS